jgi:large subunit ribosomal protein L28
VQDVASRRGAALRPAPTRRADLPATPRANSPPPGAPRRPPPARPPLTRPPPRPSPAASRVCDLTGKKANNGMVVTFSHKRIHKLQKPNLQYKKIFWPEGQRWVSLRVCTKAMKTVEKNGLQAMADEAGIDLWKLPFVDARPARREWLAANQPQQPRLAKNARKMKNADKLAASTKTPLVARYVSGKVATMRSEAKE